MPCVLSLTVESSNRIAGLHRSRVRLAVQHGLRIGRRAMSLVADLLALEILADILRRLGSSATPGRGIRGIVVATGCDGRKALAGCPSLQECAE